MGNYAVNYTVINIHLGEGEIGESRKKALEGLAIENGCTWGGKPSIGRYLIKIADKKRQENSIVLPKVAGHLLDDRDGSSEYLEVQNWTNDLSDEEINEFWSYAKSRNLRRRTETVDGDTARFVARSELEKLQGSER